MNKQYGVLKATITPRHTLRASIVTHYTLKAKMVPGVTLKASISKPTEDDEKVFILRDEAGNQVVGVLASTETVLTATVQDIRKGETAVTEEGMVVGEKIIPAYHTHEGTKLIMPNKEMVINFSAFDIPYYDYTKLQAIICVYNTTISNSVNADKVSINDKVYNVNSTEVLSSVTKRIEDKTISFGIVNELEKPCVVRYFTYKEMK